MNVIQELAKILKDENLSIVVFNNGEYIKSDDKSIKTMLELIKTKTFFLKDSYVADKVVGKAAALLFAKAGVSEVYAIIISKPALEVLREHDIKVVYEKQVDNIINRLGDDICPMEKRVLDISDPDKAFDILK